MHGGARPHNFTSTSSFRIFAFFEISFWCHGQEFGRTAPFCQFGPRGPTRVGDERQNNWGFLIHILCFINSFYLWKQSTAGTGWWVRLGAGKLRNLEGQFKKKLFSSTLLSALSSPLNFLPHFISLISFSLRFLKALSLIKLCFTLPIPPPSSFLNRAPNLSSVLPLF